MEVEAVVVLCTVSRLIGLGSVSSMPAPPMQPAGPVSHQHHVTDNLTGVFDQSKMSVAATTFPSVNHRRKRRILFTQARCFSDCRH